MFTQERLTEIVKQVLQAAAPAPTIEQRARIAQSLIGGIMAADVSIEVFRLSQRMVDLAELGPVGKGNA